VHESIAGPVAPDARETPCASFGPLASGRTGMRFSRFSAAVFAQRWSASTPSIAVRSWVKGEKIVWGNPSGRRARRGPSSSEMISCKAPSRLSAVGLRTNTKRRAAALSTCRSSLKSCFLFLNQPLPSMQSIVGQDGRSSRAVRFQTERQYPGPGRSGVGRQQAPGAMEHGP
jgi:hypothetical protein